MHGLGEKMAGLFAKSKIKTYLCLRNSLGLEANLSEYQQRKNLN